VLPNGTQKNRGAVENPEEQIFLEDTVRETLNFILKEYGSYVVGIRRWASVRFLSMQK